MNYVLLCHNASREVVITLARGLDGLLGQGIVLHTEAPEQATEPEVHAYARSGGQQPNVMVAIDLAMPHAVVAISAKLAARVPTSEVSSLLLWVDRPYSHTIDDALRAISSKSGTSMSVILWRDAKMEHFALVCQSSCLSFHRSLTNTFGTGRAVGSMSLDATEVHVLLNGDLYPDRGTAFREAVRCFEDWRQSESRSGDLRLAILSSEDLDRLLERQLGEELESEIRAITVPWTAGDRVE